MKGISSWGVEDEGFVRRLHFVSGKLGLSGSLNPGCVGGCSHVALPKRVVHVATPEGGNSNGKFETVSLLR